MPRPLYCTPTDVMRKFNPQVTSKNLRDWKNQEGTIGYEDYEQIQARIESVSSEFDNATGCPFRLTRYGTPGNPASWDYYGESDGVSKRGWPTQIWLERTQVRPFDPSKGDVLEVRTGRDDWQDITGQRGSDWAFNPDDSVLTLYRTLKRRVYWRVTNSRLLRMTYRHGAQGGRQDAGGQTTLSSQVDDTATTLSVSDATQLPYGGVLLLGNEEYARIQSVDYDADTVDVARGKRASFATSHESGSVVHYCPENIRDAVAARTAIECLLRDDWTDQLVDTGGGAPAPQAKREEWSSTWESAVERYATVRMA